MGIHINCKKEDIAEIVVMSGDPLRAKYIAENFLDNYKLVNDVRNMYAYTGYYKDKRITVCSHGMGIPSIGIYAFELFKYYDVKKIIRIGTCGTVNRSIKLRDLILADTAYSVSTFPLLFDGDTDKEYDASVELNNLIINKAEELNLKLEVGKIITSDVFDPFVDGDKFMSNFPDDNFLGSEMEAFGLFYLAKKLNRDASCIVTVVDSKYDKSGLTSEEREKSLNEMIILALESII